MFKGKILIIIIKNPTLANHWGILELGVEGYVGIGSVFTKPTEHPSSLEQTVGPGLPPGCSGPVFQNYQSQYRNCFYSISLNLN